MRFCLFVHWQSLLPVVHGLVGLLILPLFQSAFTGLLLSMPLYVFVLLWFWVG
ncbi:hypothetical protein BKA57DRAFT_474774 [Linnemannia elongata]|nr:hypothetical protein BKA57DRAFT_474774 [Linnemannia elongata]